jgi:hypothetical protein
MFKLEFNTANAAFDDLPSESARILRDVIKRLQQGHTGGTCRDVNGNTVGRWSLK